MFKDVFAHKPETIGTLADNLEKFAFYDKAIFGTAPHDPVKTADTLLGTPGLGYGTKPLGSLLCTLPTHPAAPLPAVQLSKNLMPA